MMAWRTIGAASFTCAGLLALASSGTAGASTYYRGVNLGSGEFAPRKVPGEYGRDYIYPDAATAEPFLRARMNAVRVPVLWERLQPEPFGALSEAELNRLDDSLSALSGFSLIVLDIHNYARYRGEPLDADNGAKMLADLWRRLAERYSGNAKLAFGIMNEPFGLEAATWRSIVNKVMPAIRATGAGNLVLVPGTRWTGGHSWTSGGAQSNAAAFRGFSDPSGNFVYEIHQYLDADSSGTSETCVDPETARRRLAAVTDWLRKEGKRAILAEFGAAANPGCHAALDALIGVVESEREAWQGWLYWAGGPWWGDYPMSIQPVGGKARPQMAVMRKYLDDPD